MRGIIENYLANTKPLLKQSAIAYWDAATTGDEKSFANYADLDLRIRKIHSDPEIFNELKSLKEMGTDITGWNISTPAQASYKITSF